MHYCSDQSKTIFSRNDVIWPFMVIWHDLCFWCFCLKVENTKMYCTVLLQLFVSVDDTNYLRLMAITSYNKLPHFQSVCILVSTPRHSLLFSCEKWEWNRTCTQEHDVIYPIAESNELCKKSCLEKSSKNMFPQFLHFCEYEAKYLSFLDVQASSFLVNHFLMIL